MFFTRRIGVHQPMNDVSFITTQWYWKTLMTEMSCYYKNVAIFGFDSYFRMSQIHFPT